LSDRAHAKNILIAATKSASVNRDRAKRQYQELRRLALLRSTWWRNLRLSNDRKCTDGILSHAALGVMTREPCCAATVVSMPSRPEFPEEGRVDDGPAARRAFAVAAMAFAMSAPVLAGHDVVRDDPGVVSERLHRMGFISWRYVKWDHGYWKIESAP
jgi:hypothetical protein